MDVPFFGEFDMRALYRVGDGWGDWLGFYILPMKLAATQPAGMGG